MLTARGLQLFINTEHKSFGKRLDASVCWVGTTYDKKVRTYYENDATHRNRKGGLMWRKRFVGKALQGYSELFEKVAVLRGKRASVVIDDGVKRGSECAEIRHITASVCSVDAIPCSGINTLLEASYGACINPWNGLGCYDTS
jgi:hypothetical protein